MPVKAPQEPLEQSEAERLRAERRAEREEARRQKKELARIEREMRGPGPRWLLPVVLGGVLLLGLVVFIGYRVWAGTVVDNARVPFEESMEKAKSDVAILSLYAAGDWQRVLSLQKQAEAGKGGARAVAKLYRQADELLVGALVKARDAASKVDFVRNNFESLYERATKLGIGELLPDLWAGVEQARAKATAEDVSSEEAVAGYRRGVDLLDGLSIDFPKITVLRQEMAAFTEQSSVFSQDEYAKAFPEDAKVLAGKLAAAKDAIKRRDWQEATSLYLGAKAELPKAIGKLRTAKTEAITAVAAFDKALAEAKNQGAPRDAQIAWQELTKEREALNQASADFQYVAVKEGADQGVAKVNEMLEQITKARTTLQQRMQEAEMAFHAAEADVTFYEANLKEGWDKVVVTFNEMKQAVGRGDDIVSLLGRANGLKEVVDAIVAQKTNMLAGLTEVQDKLAALRANPLAGLLQVNLPDKQYDAIFTVMREAQRAEERGDVTNAVAKYREWTTLLEKALKDMEALRREALDLAQSCGARAKDFALGIERFRPANRAEIELYSRRSVALIKEQNYRAAIPALKKLDLLIPAERFTFDKPGTVTDNLAGLMWASDGKGEGCMGGRQVNWHEAFRWADALVFAGFQDWRLPDEEELRLIAQLGQKEHDRAFPNSLGQIYWSGVPDTDVNQALAVDMRAVRTVLRQKNDVLYVRAVRSPK